MDKKGEDMGGVPLWIILTTLVIVVSILVSLFVTKNISTGGLFS